MVIRSIKVPSSSGVVHEYVRVVESVREHGRVRQKVIRNLRRRDTLRTIRPLRQRFVPGDAAPPRPHDGPIEALEASTGGPVLVGRSFGENLGLGPLLEACRRWPRLQAEEDPDDDGPRRVLALIAHRLVRPVSEPARAGGLETDDVGDRVGRRYLPHGKRPGRVRGGARGDARSVACPSDRSTSERRARPRSIPGTGRPRRAASSGAEPSGSATGLRTSSHAAG